MVIVTYRNSAKRAHDTVYGTAVQPVGVRVHGRTELLTISEVDALILDLQAAKAAFELEGK